MIGDPNGPPSFPMLGLGDVSTGVHAIAAIACALLYRDKTGRGQHLDVSLLDSYFHCHELNVQMYSLSGGKVKPKRAGLAITPPSRSSEFSRRKRADSYLFIMAPVDHQLRGAVPRDGPAGAGGRPALHDRGSRALPTCAEITGMHSGLARLAARRRHLLRDAARNTAMPGRADSVGRGGREPSASARAADGAEDPRPHTRRVRHPRRAAALFRFSHRARSASSVSGRAQRRGSRRVSATRRNESANWRRRAS